VTDKDLSPSLPPEPRPPEAAPLEPALGGLRDVLAIARRAPARAARLEALIRLGKNGGPEVYPALAEASTDPDWVARKYAVSGLGALGLPAALPVVLAGMADAHVEVRRAAARALKLLDDGERLAEWRTAATDTDHLVRAAAFAGLARYNDSEATEVLLAGLGDEAWLARYLALEGLSERLAPAVTPALLAVVSCDLALAIHAARELGRRAAHDPRLLPALLALLPDAPPWRRLAVAAALATIDQESARMGLASLIGYPDPEIEAAVLAHGHSMSVYLRAALSEADWIKRWHASRLLGTLDDKQAAVALLPLAHDPRPEVRLAAIGSLGQLQASEALADLAACAQDTSWRVRLAAIEALSALGEAGLDVLATLTAGLQDPRSEVRLAIRSALRDGQGGPRSAS
jgi:HEAT repeat protein